MPCTPGHKWQTFKVIALAKYLTGELGYEPLEPKSDKYSGKLLQRDEASRLAEYTFSIWPTFDASRQIRASWAVCNSEKCRESRSTCSSCGKAKEMERTQKKKISAPLAGTMGKAGNVL